ncbi:hypothetical protein GOBAR_DD13113 [Gossypium barbadense]|nr:hypothetical protein GOBAR_DD13113 [Gossypium barbadense]
MCQQFKGSKASWVWSSIIEGKDFLKGTLLWKIQNGESVDEPLPILAAEIICKERECWNLAPISKWLNNREIAEIHQIPVYNTKEQDRGVWFEVCSGLKIKREDIKSFDVKITVDYNWMNPPENWIKINCDASFKEESEMARIGVIGRDWTGSMIDGIEKELKIEVGGAERRRSIGPILHKFDRLLNEISELKFPSLSAKLIERLIGWLRLLKRGCATMVGLDNHHLLWCSFWTRTNFLLPLRTDIQASFTVR